MLKSILVEFQQHIVLNLVVVDVDGGEVGVVASRGSKMWADL